jgi:hypothetical protein
MTSTNIRTLLISIINKVEFFQLKRTILSVVEGEEGLSHFSVKGIEDGKIFGNWLWDGQTKGEDILSPEEFDLDVLLLLYTEGVVHLTTPENLTEKEQQKIKFLNKILCD